MKMLRNLHYRYHCSRCRKWARFAKKVEQYKRPRKCWYCGSTKFYRIRKRKQQTCYCGRYWFPHRYEAGQCGGFAPEVGGRSRQRAFADEVPF